MGAAFEQRAQLGVAQPALGDDQHVVQHDALVVQRAAVGRHRSGAGAADIGMVAARSDEEGGRVAAGEHRLDDGDVGQVGAAAIRIVERVDVARPHPAPVLRPAVDQVADAVAHRAEMDGDVRRVGDEPPARIEDRAGEIEPLADVDRGGAALERGAHLLGQPHEQPREDREADGVDARVRGVDGGARRGARQPQRAVGEDRRRPAGLDRDRRGRIDDQRRPRDGRAGPERLAAVERRAVPRPRHRHVHHLGRTAAAFRRPHRQRRGRQHRLDLQPLDDQRVVALEAEPVAVRRHERRRHLPGIADHDVDPLVRARVAERRGRLDRGRLAQLAPRLGGEVGERRPPFAVERHAERSLPHRAPVGERDAPGGEDARERMDQHLGHPQRVGDQAGVLPARTPEAHQRVGRRIVAARDRHRLDRVRHARHRDRDQPLRRGERVGAGARRGPHLIQERIEPGSRGFAVERPVPAGAEHRGEVPGHDPAEQQVAVGHRQRPTAAVAGRARIGARGRGADDEAAAVEAADRSAARRDRVDPEHRCRHADAADHRLLPPLERTCP